MNVFPWKTKVSGAVQLSARVVVTGIVVFIVLARFLGGINPITAIKKAYLGEVGLLIEQAADSRETEDTDTAVELARKAVQLDPNSAAARHEQAYALAADGNMLGAKVAINRTLQLDPAHAQAYVDRSTIFYNEGKFKEAIAELSQAIAIQPEFTAALLARAGIYLDQHLWDEAIADYSAVIGSDSGSISKDQFINAYTGRAYALLAKGMIKEAIPDFNQGLDLAPEAVLFHRGKLPKLQKALTTLAPDTDVYRELENLIARIKAL